MADMEPTEDDAVARTIARNERNAHEAERARQIQAEITRLPNDRIILMALSEILACVCHISSAESTALIRELWRRGVQPGREGE